MSKLLILILSIFIVLSPTNTLAGTHEVKLRNIEPFIVSDEFPQNFENGAFMFMPLASGKIKNLDFSLVLGQSTTDSNYYVYFLLLRIDDKVHVAAVSSFNLKMNQPINEKFYGVGVLLDLMQQSQPKTIMLKVLMPHIATLAAHSH